MSHYTPQAPPTALAFNQASGSYVLRSVDTLKRRRFMEGGWPTLLIGAMGTLLSDESVASMPYVDASHNVFRDTIVRLSTRYEAPPTVKEGEIGDIDTSVMFSDHPIVEQYALAYNVAVASIRFVDGELKVDVLPPDHADILFDNDGRMTKVRVARPTQVSSSGAADFVLEEWDVVGRIYSVYDNGKWVPQPNYPWLYSDGKAFAPVVFFRASKPPDWWGANRWSELIEATLEEGINWTIHRYGQLNSASGIPYTIDLEPIGQQTTDSADDKFKNRSVAAGSNTVLQLMTNPKATSGTAGVLQATFDPEKSVEAIVAAYNSRMQSLGIGDAALQRGGAESGYAIVVRREGLLRLRNQTEPMFRAADQEFVRKAVACYRIFANGPAEDMKYRVEYAPVAMGSAENKESRDQEKHDLDIGVATPASIMAARSGITVKEAQALLDEMKALETRDAVEIQAPPAPPTTPPTPPEPASTDAPTPA